MAVDIRMGLLNHLPMGNPTKLRPQVTWSGSTIGLWLVGFEVKTVRLHLYLVGGLEHFFIFPYKGNNHPNWLMFSKGSETTSQIWLENIGHQVHILGPFTLKSSAFFFALLWGLQFPLAAAHMFVSSNNITTMGYKPTLWQVKLLYFNSLFDIFLLHTIYIYIYIFQS